MYRHDGRDLCFFGRVETVSKENEREKKGGCGGSRNYTTSLSVLDVDTLKKD